MDDIQKTVNEILKETRIRKRLTQAEVADKVGCSQSAISMFEVGGEDALSREKIAAIAESLGLDMDVGSLPIGTGGSVKAVLLAFKYCTIDDCPSNVPYVVGGKLVFRPVMVECCVDETTPCEWCGDTLLHRCPEKACRAPLRPSSVCAVCGTTLVTAAHEHSGSLTDWVLERRAEIKELRAMTQSHRL